MNRLLATFLTITFLALGCTDSGPTEEEFGAAMEGILADPATYELTILECVNDGEAVEYRWGLKNTGTERRTFAFDPVLTNSDGVAETKNRVLVAESLAPGEYREWDSWNGGGERFPVGDVECRFEVVESPLGLFRDE